MFAPQSRAYLQDPAAAESTVLEAWSKEDLLHRTLEERATAPPFVFYEGPPTANGRPGIHHVFSRSLKDAMCRFEVMRGHRVERKAGWDTHGLPVELEVEKQLGISGKPEIEKFGIGPFNQRCQDSVFTYKSEWEEVSRRVAYELDYEHPYVTYHPDYIESVWFLLSRFSKNDLLYRGSKVLPWCGRCGTGLSSHEVGQGYADIDDPSVWVSFPLLDAPGELAGAGLVGWTTTPWTLPSNMAACVHPKFRYALAEKDGQKLILLANQVEAALGEEAQILGEVAAEDLIGLAYEPLFPALKESAGARIVHEGARQHVVVADDFVSADDGTGIVHMAPYGADDFRIAQREDLLAVLAVGEEARFTTQVGEVQAGTFFRDANQSLVRDLKGRGRLVKQQQYRHSYPHCWRCDTPLIYFPAPAWFLRTTSYKDKMVEQNRKIRWSPAEIGQKRFGEWLENNIDWALSRDRYWGTPLPVWVNDEDPEDWVCVSSFAELSELAGGLPEDFDPHRPVVDAISFPSPTPGKTGTMRRVPQVIDCWFDSGAMPYAQYHWPFENRDKVAEQFPADFICEGLDQTRGWFYSLHAIAVFLTQVDQDLWSSGDLWGNSLPRLEAGGAYRSCMVNGLLLDKDGVKMSKRIGNIVVPAQALSSHGADAIRWSLLSGGATHLSRRYDDKVIAEVRRRVLGTLTASYDFLALYARTEQWSPEAPRTPREERAVLDRWILSRAHFAAEEVTAAFASLQPSNALRVIEGFLVDELSNWYIRRSRRRFWGHEGEASQASAFATLHEVLEVVLRLMAPITPFVTDQLWRQLGENKSSIHLANWPQIDTDPCLAGARDGALEEAMDPILRASSLGRAVRERVQIRVRQPLARLVVHVAHEQDLGSSPRAYSDALREELNVKEVEWVDGTPDFLEVTAKPDFPRLGKRAGKDMKALAAAIAGLDRTTVFALQGGATTTIMVEDRAYEIEGADIKLQTQSADGLEASTDGVVTIGLVTALTPELEAEGLAREVLNRLQTQRKEAGFEVSDRIQLELVASAELQQSLASHLAWIAEEVLAPNGLQWASDGGGEDFHSWELPGELQIQAKMTRITLETA